MFGTILSRGALTSALLGLIGFCTLASAVPIPAPPTLAATSHLLVDFQSGHVIAESNPDERAEPASLTKIMTAYVVFRELAQNNVGLDDPVTISAKAWRTPGSRMFVEVGKRVKVEDLLKGMIVQSGNDASVALAEFIAGSEETFAELMNTHAARLGMANSHFVNSTGLPDPEHYTTARDITRVTAATIREFPEYYKWYAEPEFTFNDIKQQNRNRLLARDDSVDGVKTGHTDSAGYCLVASAVRDGTRLISVVMGTQSEEARAKQSQTLLNYGFRFFETHRLYAASEPQSRMRVWKGAIEQLPIGLEKDFYVTIPRHQYKNLKASMILTPLLAAPVSQGAQVGMLSVSLQEDTLAQAPLVALQDVAEGGWWQIIKDTVLLWFE